MILFFIPIALLHLLLFGIIFISKSSAIMGFTITAYLFWLVIWLWHRILSSAINTTYLDSEHAKCLKTYYFAIASPPNGKILCTILLSFRILLFVWVPLSFLWGNHVLSVILIFYWFISSNLTLRLNPVPIFQNAAQKGNSVAMKELETIQQTVVFREINYLDS